MSRKAFTVGVVATTIAWSIGLSALLAPLSAGAAASGSLVKASLPAVYYVGADGKRYVFPNEKTYKTWYSDFSGVQTITDAELAAMPIGGNVTYKPGLKMVKITTDPKVYAVDAHGTLRWVTSEAVAVALYGANWNQMIDDVPDAFFTNYTIGADITSSSSFVPSAVLAAAGSINSDKNLGATAGASGLSVMISATPAVGGSLPGGATSVPMLKFDVRNGGSSAMVVDTLTIQRSGSGASTDYANLYVYLGNQRLTTGRSLNTTSNQATFTGLNLSLASGESKSLVISADMAAFPGAGNTDVISVVDLRSGANQAGGLPLAGPTFTMATATVGSITITRSGANPLSNVKSGGLNQKMAEFQLTAGSSEDVSFTKIALFRGGSVSRQYVTNITLKQAGNVIAHNAEGFDANDRVTLVLDTPMVIARGNVKTFEVYADIGAGARTGVTETILTYLDQTTDLLAVGQTYGYGVTVIQGVPAYDGTGGCALGVGNCSSTRIEGGQVTITFNGPTSKNVPINGKNVELFNFTLAAQANLEVRNLRLQITQPGVPGAGDGLVDTTVVPNVANYTNIKVVDTATSSTVAGPKDVSTIGADNTQALNYTEIFNLTAGQARTFSVQADIANQVALNGQQVRIDLNPFLGTDIRNLDNSTYVAVTDIVPNALIGGNADTVQSPSLTASVGSTPTAQTYIQGSQGVALGSFGLKAGDSQDVRISSLQIQGLIDTWNGVACGVPDGVFAFGQDGAACGNVASTVLQAKLWNGSTQLGDTKSPSASTGVGTGGVLTFDNMNLLVPAGQTVTLTLTGNLASALAATPVDLRFEITAAGSLSVTDKDGNTVNALATPAFPLDAPSAVTAMRVAATGTLTVVKAPDDTESEAGNVVGGGSNVVLAKYKFTAQNEELRVNKMEMMVTSPTSATSLALYDGATLVGGPVSVSGGGLADFSGVNFVVPKDSSKVLTVKGNLNTVGSSGAVSGVNAQVTLTAGAGTFEARGTSAGSSTLITEATVGLGVPVVANDKILRKTKPTISLVSLPSTVLTTGDVVAMRFTVAADAGADVSFKEVNANVSLSSAGGTVAIGAASCIRRVGDSTNLPGGCAIANANPGGALQMGLDQEEVVSAGTSKSYDIRLAIGGALLSGDSLSTRLLGDASLVIPQGVIAPITTPGTFNYTVAAAPANFIWSDNSGIPHSDGSVLASSTDWFDGTYVKVLPTDSQTMSK